MTIAPTWDEEYLSEKPAVELLEKLGYALLSAEDVKAAREGLRSAILTQPLEAALRKLNPWLIEDNLARAVRAVAMPNATSLIEANEAIHTAITRGISVQQDYGGKGLVNRTVRFLDFENLWANTFQVARQFRVQGSHTSVRFDIVVFVNGLPLAIIECKSPTTENAIEKAVEQLLEYQEQSDLYTGAGAPRAFESTQLLIALARDQALYSSVGSPARYYFPYPEAYPKLPPSPGGRSLRLVTAQDALLYSLLHPESLLEIVRNLVAFEVDKGRTIKKVARHQQRIAIDRAVHRVTMGKSPLERGGVIWHTQGSGKSLTMVWLAQRLRDPLVGLQNPTLVIVSDRTDLDQQITGTFRRVGFPNPQQATGARDLEDLLRKGNGLTILTTVQKFYDATGGEALNDSDNLFVMVDEAHRTQYSSLAARMRASLPKATYFGFTGTPIDKDSKSTLREFGSYIHTYTIEESVRDGATVPIFYEGRELEAFGIEGRSLEERAEEVLAEYPEGERERVKAKFNSYEIIAAAPRRVRELARDIKNHYLSEIRPNGFKAQLVAVNRETAVRYKGEFDKLEGMPESVVIFSGYRGDTLELRKHHTTKKERKALIDRFTTRGDPLCLLIVVDMLLTGFDAPIEQVMYLDAPLKEHNLLQAIARVNRVDEGKDYGLIVDYWGISEHLQEVLSAFDERELGEPMRPKRDELRTLEATHREVMRHFDGIGRDDLDGLLKRIEPPDTRARFDEDYRAFTSSLNLMYPDPKALLFEEDLKWLSDLRAQARNRFRDPRLGYRGIAKKIRAIIEDSVTASGVKVIMDRMSILSPEFDQKLQALDSDEARASEIAYAIKHEITVRESENPVYYRSLREQLEHVIEVRREQRLTEAEQLLRLFPIRDEIRRGARDAAKELGLSSTGFAFYKLLEERGVDQEQRTNLAAELEQDIRSEIVIDWTSKEDVKRQMRKNLRRSLMKRGVTREAAEPIILEILDTAAARMAQP